MSVGHTVPSVKFLHFIRDLSLKTHDTVQSFSHILHVMHLKCIFTAFYGEDYVANIIQKKTHL